MLTLYWVVVLFLVVAAAFVLLTRRLLRYEPAASLDREWLEGFSVAKYRPMERLLAEDDFRFLAAQPGFDRGIARKLRAERRRIFLAYLAQLRRDFQKLHGLASLMVLYSSDDRPDLAATLFRQRLVFYVALAGIYARLGATWIFPSVPVRVHGLITSLETLRNQIVLSGPQWEAC